MCALQTACWQTLWEYCKLFAYNLANAESAELRARIENDSVVNQVRPATHKPPSVSPFKVA